MKELKPFGDNANYWCIRSVIQVFSSASGSKYRYKLIGLGSDDRLYIYTKKGWREK